MESLLGDLEENQKILRKFEQDFVSEQQKTERVIKEIKGKLQENLKKTLNFFKQQKGQNKT